jgi:hypothetical protein
MFVHGSEEFVQALGRDIKRNTAHAVVVLKCKEYTFLVFGGHGRASILVIDDERQGWRMVQHVRYRGTVRAQKL